MTTQADIEKELKGALNLQFTCPDGKNRLFVAFEIVDNVVTLQFRGGYFPEFDLHEFETEWNRFTPVHDGFVVPIQTEPSIEPSRKPSQQLSQPPTQVQDVATHSATLVQSTRQQADEVMDTSEMVKLLGDQMKKVAGGNPAAVDQAHAMANLARQMLEAGKLRLNIMKVVHQINQPAK